MTEESQSNNIKEEDLFKILIATDIHLGYNEKDCLRGNDSFIAFEEILENAVANDVDFILLGGDLFHDAKPTPNTMQKCLQLLRKFTLGDKPIGIEFLSDQNVNFKDSLNKTVNYQDPNINIAYPIFSIHGNHDDPSGFGRVSSLDLLSTTGMINYFGKWTDLTKINISPILMKKGDTQLALYGLSYIHDGRLARLFHESKVIMEKPDQDSGDWFNIMVVHQNRADRGPKNFLPEEELPDFLDLILWGHEHDCRIWPEENAKRNFYVTQPGSSVATSLSEGESIDKHVAILLVHKKQFKLEPIKLKTVRPFVFETINIDEFFDELGLDEGDVSSKVQKFVSGKIEKLISNAKDKLSDHPKQPKEPLIRLRIHYSDEDHIFNGIRFGQQYHALVANAMDMILFKKIIRKNKGDTKCLDENAMKDEYDKQKDILNDENLVEDIVGRYFANRDESDQLEVAFIEGLSEVTRRLVSLDDDDAAEKIIEFHREQACNYLNENLKNEDDLTDELVNYRTKSEGIYDLCLKMLDARGSTVKQPSVTSLFKATNDASSDDDVILINNRTTRAKTPPPKPTRGRGSRGGSRGGARGGTRGNAKAVVATTKVTPQKQLDITVTKITKQPSISSSFMASQRQPSQRTAAVAKRSTKFTQYISDSDSN